MKRRLLITGGVGFIGTHLAEALLDEYDVVLFDNFRRDSLQHAPRLAKHPSVSVVQGDVLDPESVARAMEGADAVLHLAAIAGVSSYYKEPVKTLRVNILGTVNVLEAMRRTGTRRIVDFSTSEVYGVKAKNVSEESLHGIGPVSQRRWVYAVSKLASEHFTLRYGDEFGLESTCVRPFNIYGPRQTGEGCISNFCTNLLAGKPICIYGDGKEVRAWCFVSDMVQAVRLILKTQEAAGKTFNIGNPSQAPTTVELARMLVRIHGRGEIQHIESTHNGIPVRIPDITLARTVLGFEPRVDLTEGLTKTLHWFGEVQR